MVEQEREERRRLDLWMQRRRRRLPGGARGEGGVSEIKSEEGGATNGMAKNKPRLGVGGVSFPPGESSSSPSSEGAYEGTTTTTTTRSPRGSRKSRSRPSKAGGGPGGSTAGRKMVRRGMEMLVGGEPINADPPQRFVELNYYRKHPRLWARAITTNSPDFGPLMHMHSAGKVGDESLSLFCENFVAVTCKWGICPEDLRRIVSERAPGGEGDDISISENDVEVLIRSISLPDAADDCADADDDGIDGRAVIYNSRELDAPRGFGAQTQSERKRRDSLGGRSGISSEKSLGPMQSVSVWDSSAGDTLNREGTNSDDRLTFTLGGELKFSLGVSRSEIESSAFRRVLLEGIGLSINADELGFDVQVAKLVLVDMEEGSTDITVQFQLCPREHMGVGEAKRAAKEVNGALASAMDDGKMAMMLARAAREEKGWPVKIRDRLVEEFLFEIEDEEEKEYVDDADADDDDTKSDNMNLDEYDRPLVMDGNVLHAKDDMWLGGGNGGVFFDYSELNYSNSPYKGKLGPYFVDAAIERARQNQPRVIAIGDVHGCIDELKALLKKCDYHPGDTIVFLGDLVCKGPDSLSVVQMAREVGAIGVRGNHDFEVVRWHQAIKSGADPPVIGSEHYHVASALSTADLKWMYSLPWFISSSHLNALFVHAGFVSGIRLAKQNPRLMMNMRSILPDGTVTSKFFNNWPWARLWDGPQTVFFGHDADRGLQQYEHAIGLDTGCVYGGKLTACILPERRLVSVNAKREYFQYRRKHFD
ncbi:hypothetical protein ACHAXA_000175 [Cyclostephanos tholiformis]|uniref:Calcineurin-like phosphoesterase domain-containing protein n=1 Tax=Cyclostephanos tholiformis TaxID=382380 RepID=A0ABD3R6Q1_9STRA